MYSYSTRSTWSRRKACILVLLDLPGQEGKHVFLFHWIYLIKKESMYSCSTRSSWSRRKACILVLLDLPDQEGKHVFLFYWIYCANTGSTEPKNILFLQYTDNLIIVINLIYFIILQTIFEECWFFLFLASPKGLNIKYRGAYVFIENNHPPPQILDGVDNLHTW